MEHSPSHWSAEATWPEVPGRDGHDGSQSGVCVYLSQDGDAYPVVVVSVDSPANAQLTPCAALELRDRLSDLLGKVLR